MNWLTADAGKRAVCLLISLVDNFAIALIIPLLPSIAAAGGAAPGEWVWVLALNGACLTLGPFIWGRVVNPRNSSHVIAGTLLVKALCTVTLVFAFDSWVWLLVNRALSGAMSGTTLATRLWLVTRFPAREMRARSIANLSMASSLGIGLGGLLAVPVFAAGAGVESVTRILVYALAALLVCAAVLARKSLEGLLAPKNTGAAAPATKPTVQAAISALEAGAVLGAHTFSRVAVYAFPTLLLLQAEQGGSLTHAFVAMLLGLLAVLEIPGQFVVNALIANFGYRSSSLALAVLCGLGVAIPAAVLANWPVALSCVLVALCGGALQSVLSVYLTELKAERIAPWLGASQGMTGAARTIAPLLASLAFTVGAGPSFLVLVVPLALAGICIAFIGSELSLRPLTRG